MTKEELLEAAGQAILNLNEPKLGLKFAERTSSTSNLWRIGLKKGSETTEVGVYLFSDCAPASAVELIQEQLERSLR